MQDQLRGSGSMRGGINTAPLESSRSPERSHTLEAWKNERDLLRQEAKMEEMREEVRRREERIAREKKIQELQQQQQQQQHQQQRWGSNQPYPVSGPPSNQPYSDRGPQYRGPPPMAPKPRFPATSQLTPSAASQVRPSYNQDAPPERPPPPADELLGSRNSPQPPPPPPSSTHPLYQQMQIRSPPQGGYRYGPGGLSVSRSAEHFDK